MVIDKTTGRGCALSIISKVITRKLVADGIIGKAIYRKHCMINKKEISVLFRVVKFKYEKNVYVVSQKSGELSDEPLWTPSFIDASVWEQAISRFSNHKRLDYSVEKYLLPNMDEYLQSISDEDLSSLTRDFLIEHDVINTPIRQCAGKTYYFGENEIYSLDKKSELFPYESRLKFNIFNIKNEYCFNMNVWSKAASQFEVGMTLEECISIFLKTKLVHSVPRKQSPIDKLVQHIDPPIYERVPENNNEATFDYIRVIVGLPRFQFNSWKTLQNNVKKYRQKIYQQVIQKIKNDPRFKKYGVPITSIKLSNAILLKNFSIEFIFEPKDVLSPNMEN